MSDLEQQIRDLSKEKFESLIHQLLDAKYPGAGITRVEGSGGDKGIDSFRGTLSIGAAIWQDKHFRNRIGKSQKRQILKSIQSAFKGTPPASWTLCVPINLRTEEHEWFQSEVVAKYGGPEKIKLMQAADILRDLIHNRPLRDAFFPGNSISNVLKVRQIAMKTEGLTTDESGELATEHAHQYLEAKTDLEPRPGAPGLAMFETWAISPPCAGACPEPSRRVPAVVYCFSAHSIRTSVRPAVHLCNLISAI